jgi:hypothetical protein
MPTLCWHFFGLLYCSRPVRSPFALTGIAGTVNLDIQTETNRLSNALQFLQRVHQDNKQGESGAFK